MFQQQASMWKPHFVATSLSLANAVTWWVKTRTFALITVIAYGLTLASSAQAQTQPEGTVPQQPVQIRALADSKVALQNGAFTSLVPIAAPDFRGITPKLALTYNSSGSSGFIGVGWDLQGFSMIERASPSRGGPRYSQAWTNDIYLLDGEELVPSTALGGTHATRRQSFLRIAGYGATSNWTVTQRDGTAMTYSPVFTAGANTFRWGLTRVQDTHGNVVNYNWWCDTSGSFKLECYPSSITYADVAVTFNRESRPDMETFATGYNLGRRNYRLLSIDITAGGSRRNIYSLGYTTSTRTGRSLLTKVQQFGKDAVTALPPTTMAYSDTASGFDTAVDVSGSYGLTADIWYNSKVFTADFNGDGRSDLLLQNQDVSAPKAFLLLAQPSGGFNNAVDITNSYVLHP